MSRSEPRPKRPFVVAEFVYTYGYHGRVWTVGCLTEEAAWKSFYRRVASRLAAGDVVGAVIAYERATSRPICWTGEITDPVKALDYWVHGQEKASSRWVYDADAGAVTPRPAG